MPQCSKQEPFSSLGGRDSTPGLVELEVAVLISIFRAFSAFAKGPELVLRQNTTPTTSAACSIGVLRAVAEPTILRRKVDFDDPER